MKMNNMNPCLCPNCGNLLECASHLSDDSLKPRPGDYSICIGCGTVLRFTSDMKVTEVTEDEFLSLNRDIQLELGQMVMAWKMAYPEEIYRKEELKN